jgi:hypothetical protein
MWTGDLAYVQYLGSRDEKKRRTQPRGNGTSRHYGKDKEQPSDSGARKGVL